MTLVLACSAAVLAAGAVSLFIWSSRPRRRQDAEPSEAARYVCSHCSDTDCVCTHEDE